MTVETELTELEQQIWAANRAGDGGTYERLLRADALLVSRFGVATKDQIVPMIQRNENPFERTELSDQRVVEVSPDSALITYRADVTTAAGLSFSVLATSVYARADGSWRLALHQQTVV